MKIESEKNTLAPTGTLKELLRDYEKQILAQVLKRTNYNKTRTADILDMDLSWLYKKIKQYGLAPDNSRRQKRKTVEPIT